MKIGARLILTKFVDSALKDIRRNNQHDAPQIILRTNQQDSAARHFHIRRGYGKPEDLSWCKGYNDDGLSIVEYWILERIEDLQVLRCALCNTIMACKGERKTASSLGLDLRTLISVPQTSQ
jgi:hypothetical protein